MFLAFFALIFFEYININSHEIKGITVFFMGIPVFPTIPASRVTAMGLHENYTCIWNGVDIVKKIHVCFGPFSPL